MFCRHIGRLAAAVTEGSFNMLPLKPLFLAAVTAARALTLPLPLPQPLLQLFLERKHRLTADAAAGRGPARPQPQSKMMATALETLNHRRNRHRIRAGFGPILP